MEFVSFELAKKLKEKGFSCKYPLAMYNESGWFCPLYTSADRNPNIKSVFGNREYYDYDHFDEHDFIAPTIEQVLEWLRKEKNLFVAMDMKKPYPYSVQTMWGYIVMDIYKCEILQFEHIFNSYEQAALAGIEYTLDNLL